MSATARKQRAITSDRVDPTKPAAIIINDQFEGLTNFCRLTGYPTSTAWRWTLIGFIPPRWRGESTHVHILKVAAENEYPTTAADFVERPVVSSPAGPSLADDCAAAPKVATPRAAAHPVSVEI